MTSEVVVSALDVRVGLQGQEDLLVPAIRRLWSRCLMAGPGPDVVVPVPTHDGTPDSIARALQSLTQSVTLAAIEGRAGRDVMFHAGGLSNIDTGATIVYIAPGGTGKTTLTRTLGRDRGYVSDETIAVSSDGSITPYPKPLSVRRQEGVIKDETSPDALGLGAPRTAPWLAGLIVLRRDLPAGRSIEVEDIGTLDAMALIAPETSSLARLDRPLARLAAVLELAGGLRVVRYHESSQLEPLVSDVLGAAQ